YANAGSIPGSDRAAVFEEYVNAFRAAVASQNFKSAAEWADHATQVFPKLRRPWNHLAMARLRLEAWGPAIEAARLGDAANDDAWSPSVTPDETRAGSAYLEGVAMYDTQRYSEALARVRTAVALAPEWAPAAPALA